MSQKQGMTGTAVAVSAVVIISLAAMGYYQYVYVGTSGGSTATTTPSSTATEVGKVVVIDMVIGAATKGNQAFAPDVVKLVVGVNNSIVFYNGDVQGGAGIPHTGTAKTCPNDCPFDTGVLQGGQNSSVFVISKPGTYNYFCEIHPTMVGQIIVVQGSGAATATTTTGQSSSSPAGNSTAAQSQSSNSSSSTGAAVQVAIPKGAASDNKSQGYSPSSVVLVIGVNNTVTWTNNDNAIHTVTDNAGYFDSKNILAGGTFTFTFTKPGTYDYHCIYHPWMKGTVIVKG